MVWSKCCTRRRWQKPWVIPRYDFNTAIALSEPYPIVARTPTILSFKLTYLLTYLLTYTFVLLLFCCFKVAHKKSLNPALLRIICLIWKMTPTRPQISTIVRTIVLLGMSPILPMQCNITDSDQTVSCFNPVLALILIRSKLYTL